jgi:hypothetical protein
MGLLFVVVGCQDQLEPDATDPNEAIASLNPTDAALVVRVPAKATETTLVGMLSKNPPPWVKGNCIKVSPTPELREAERWHVANMHGENFNAFVAKVSIKAIRVLPFEGRYCLIVDPRVPREWFLDVPCDQCVRGPVRDKITSYPQFFR